ncbi:PREDICTED: probable receptor-like protein kinase At1g67000 [Erythranthe guttata]|uniref:probable receptor-like protein kinase At1g67000 n=1 Tax=Erythranthe guttata TaxID=4155 RepID=UPI00064E09F3|nr:PREDICTED: probable receptor-like protein kinase At1g67000 [Erythranthe guttata]|eukprot:XP_012854663.1 PREDICTED: probable receptor-like protein kinase At1g67000 [Erythranthe guttata]
MERKIDQRILQLILASLVVLLVIQPCLCQNDQQYETCRQPFRCGSMNTELAYPFWGGDRPPACGYPGFELNCGGDGPLLSMPPLLYRVFDFNNSTQTVRVSRGDLWNNICPQFLFNTTLNFSLFDFYSAADDQNITLYYGCGLNQSLLTPSTFPNQFNCDVNGTNSWSLFFTREASGLGDGATCSNSISVPVNQNAARDLGVVATTSTTLLQSALASGFSIRWSAENDSCDECARSGGACGYNQDAASFACYCRDGHRNSSCSNDTPPGGGNGTCNSFFISVSFM